MFEIFGLLIWESVIRVMWFVNNEKESQRYNDVEDLIGSIKDSKVDDEDTNLWKKNFLLFFYSREMESHLGDTSEMRLNEGCLVLPSYI